MWTRLKGLTVAALILGLVVGCGGGSSGGSSGSDAVGGQDGSALPPLPAPELFEPPSADVLIGRVMAFGGQPVAGATVQAEGGALAVTNSSGYYYLDGIDLGTEVVVTFSAPGYSPVTKKGTVNQGTTSTLNALLLPHVRSAEVAAEGGEAAFDRGGLSLTAGAVETVAGKPVTGTLRVRMTIIDIRSDELIGAPGDFSARDAGGLNVQLETFGLADISLEQDGEPLQLKEGETAALELLLPEDTKLGEGDEVPLWYFDETDGKWVEEGKGTVQASSGAPGRLAVVGEVGHFSWWNADYPMEVTCLKGQVKSCDGAPAAGAFVLAQGLTYDGLTSAHTDDQGNFCLPVMVGSTVKLTAGFGWGENTVLDVIEVDVPADPGSCDEPDGCTIQDLTLPCDPSGNELDCTDTYFVPCKGCAKGKVVDGAGNAVEFAEVTAKTGNTTYKKYTDSDGVFCIPASVGGATTIVAQGGGAISQSATLQATEGVCPDCEEIPTLVLGTASGVIGEDHIDLCECLDLPGKVTVENIVVEGLDPAFLNLTAGFGDVYKLMVDDPGDPEELKWSFDLVFYPPCESSANDLPFASARFYHHGVDLPSGSPFNGSLELLDMYGDAASPLGIPEYMGKQVLKLNAGDPEDPGPASSITITSDSVDPGKMVEGTFDLFYFAQCAPIGGQLRIMGKFELPIDGLGADIHPDIAGKLWAADCDSTGFQISMDRGPTHASFGGGVQLDVDGLPMGYANGEAVSAIYWPKYDHLRLEVATGQVQLSVKVKEPVSGENEASSGILVLSGEPDCLYTPQGGTVFINGSPGSPDDYAFSGTFDLNFDDPTGAPGCSPHKVAGSFMAPTCAY